MSGGRLIAVVGASGVGKDSVMAGIVAADPSITLVRRTITRAAHLGGEDFNAVSREAFVEAAARDSFCLHWEAHGLRYGIPKQVRLSVEAGRTCLANLSRSVLSEAQAVFPGMLVLNITASAETLAKRLAGRGRESEAEIAARLSRADTPLPSGLDVVNIPNDGSLEQTVAAACAAIEDMRVTS